MKAFLGPKTRVGLLLNTRLASKGRISGTRSDLPLLPSLLWTSFCDVSIDEMMVKCMSRFAAIKVRMPLKPCRDGLKIFALCDSACGYTYAFQVYSGAANGPKEGEDRENLGATAELVIWLISHLPSTGYRIFMDNYFTMVTLFRHISGVMKQNACGTARTNRIPKEMKGKKNKKDAGKVKVMSTKDKGAPLTVLSWMDKGLVYFLSTFVNHDEPLSELMRRTRAVVQAVVAPVVALLYNDGMGGVDRADQYRSTYTTRRRSRRWWMNLYYWMLDVAVVNAYCCYTNVVDAECARAKKDGDEDSEEFAKDMKTHLAFRRGVVLGLLAKGRELQAAENGTTPRKTRGRPRSSGEGAGASGGDAPVARVRRSSRMHGVVAPPEVLSVGSHWLEKLLPAKEGSRNRKRCKECALDGRGDVRTMWLCRTCADKGYPGVYLCVKGCHEAYHSRVFSV